jgi:hypothetical protein
LERFSEFRFGVDRERQQFGVGLLPRMEKRLSRFWFGV